MNIRDSILKGQSQQRDNIGRSLGLEKGTYKDNYGNRKSGVVGQEYKKRQFNPNMTIVGLFREKNEDKKLEIRTKLKRSYWKDEDIDRALEETGAHFKERAGKSKAKAEQIRAKRWDSVKYDKWIKDHAYSNDGEEFASDYGYDMAQNALHTPGMMDYMKNKIRMEGGDETPLERIQWDIEANIE